MQIVELPSELKAREHLMSLESEVELRSHGVVGRIEEERGEHEESQELKTKEKDGS